METMDAPNIEPGKGRLVYDKARRTIVAQRGEPLPTDTKLWIEHPASSLPMTARAYATCIMEDLMKAGMDVPLQTIQGYTTQDAITAIVKQAMDKAVETHRETRWWRRLERKITGRVWP